MRTEFKIVDYPFLITIGGIGALVSLAGIILGLASGLPSLGYFLGALALGVAAFVIARILYAGRKSSTPKAVQTTDALLQKNISGGKTGCTLEQLGHFLDCSDNGLVAFSAAGALTYANDIFLHWIRGKSEKALELPCSFPEFSNLGTGELKGHIQLRTLSGENIILDFLPLDADFICLDRGNADLYQVMACQPDLAEHENIVQNINMDQFFRESPIGIAIVTEQGEILKNNRIFRNYVSELEVKNGRSLKHIIDPGDNKDFYSRIELTMQSGQSGSSGDIGFKGRGEKYGHLYITRLRNFEGHDRVAVLYLIDTTEQKNLELQFAQSQKMQAVGQLAGGIAHDFNNLLTAIIGFSDLLLVRHGPGDQSFSDIIQVKQNAARAANLVRQLLAFSRQQTLQPEILSLTDILAELSNLLGRLIGDNIELDIRHGRELGLIKADYGQMEQVIINLCVNARDAMESRVGDNQARIVIRTRNFSYAESRDLSRRYQVMPPGEYVLLEVEDTGCGIDAAHLGKIFEPFFSTKEVGKGTGLGLSTVYGIVKQTDGFIFPASEVDKGTIFSIYLPIYKDKPAEKPTHSPEVDKPARDLTGQATILLVEDEDAVRMFASRALKNKGYKVYEANSGSEAISLYEEIGDELDLLISDVVMPVMDGPTLVRKIRETNKNLRVIFISGYAEDAFDRSGGDKSRGEKGPGESDFHFLPKPFSLKQLAEQVKEVLEGK